MHILVAEDSQAFFLCLQQMLEPHRLTNVASFDRMMAELHGQRWDGVLVDLQLEDSHYSETADRMGDVVIAACGAPVVTMTGFHINHERLEASGVARSLEKGMPGFFDHLKAAFSEPS